MKIALYIEDGLEQIVLTPESETEKGILGKLSDGSRQLDIKKGSFFTCKGGWMRHGVHQIHTTYGRSEEYDESTMIILTPLRDKQGALATDVASEIGKIITIDRDDLPFPLRLTPAEYEDYKKANPQQATDSGFPRQTEIDA